MFQFGVRQYEFSKNKIVNESILYLLIFFTIALSRDTLYTYAKFNFFITFITYIGIIAICGIVLLIKYYKQGYVFREKATWFILFYIVAILLSSLIKLDFQLYVLSILFYIGVAYLFIHIFTFDDFFKKFSNLLCILGVYSLVCCYVLRPFLFKNFDSIPLVTNSVGLQFFDLELSFVVPIKTYLRNFGIFREPGVYGIFINIALLYELIYNPQKYRFIHIVILLLTCVSTFSPPAIAVTGLFVLVGIIKAILEKRLSKNQLMIICGVLLLAVIIFIIACCLNYHLYMLVTETVKKLVTVNDSTSARGNSLFKDINQFLHSPIWGNDFSVVLADKTYSIASTTGFFALFGLLGGTFHILSFWLIVKKDANKLWLKFTLLFGLLILFNTQFIVGNPIFWIFSFSSFMLRDNENDEENQFDIIKSFREKSLKLKTGFTIKSVKE
ncbi:hypothetical protein RBG61_13250 [Paludicola sp. MB14-C6]|uniref:hypothetical protein n=1 Tax=Paludihabitans sp. MB14-C6 TaxID=3070656 RepID=UPI0027DC0E11|nr:hypothetical protein [Paludicola sp. MB14-C6]WMJ22940.1 hypothetical protein RBG61_13250 [Paludicola sp. MB14-C6]